MRYIWWFWFIAVDHCNLQPNMFDNSCRNHDIWLEIRIFVSFMFASNKFDLSFRSTIFNIQILCAYIYLNIYVYIFTFLMAHEKDIIFHVLMSHFLASFRTAFWCFSKISTNIQYIYIIFIKIYIYIQYIIYMRNKSSSLNLSIYSFAFNHSIGVVDHFASHWCVFWAWIWWFIPDLNVKYLVSSIYCWFFFWTNVPYTQYTVLYSICFHTNHESIWKYAQNKFDFICNSIGVNMNPWCPPLFHCRFTIPMGSGGKHMNEQ